MMVIRGVEVSDKDLNQRFQHNYIEVQIRKEKVEIIQVDEFNANELYCRGRRRMPEEAGGAIQQADVKIIREFPDLGAIEYEGNVHFLSRLPFRQWTRGLNPGVIKDYCRNPDHSTFKVLNIKKARAVFYPTYTNWKVGIPRLKNEEIGSFAHNQKFWFSGNRRTVYLWYEEVPVGEIQRGTLFFNPQCLLLKQEVKDEFKNAFEIV